MASSPKSENRIGKVDRKSDAMLLAVVDETLEKVFKGVGVEVIYASFEKNFQLKREDILKNPDVFSAGLEKLLGSAAAVIEKLIVRNLYQRVGLDHAETEGLQFSDEIKELKQKSMLTEEKAIDDSRKEEASKEKPTLDNNTVVSAVVEEDRIQATETKSLASLYESILDSMQIGLDVWSFENPDDTRTLKLIFSNPAAEHITGLPRKAVLGRTLTEVFPVLLNTEFPRICAEVVRSGKAKDLGEIQYGDERIPGSIFSVKAFPLPDNCIGLTLEKPTARQETEETLQEEERYCNLVETVPETIYTI